MSEKVEMTFQAFLNQKISSIEMISVNLLAESKKLKDITMDESWTKNLLALISVENKNNLISIDAADILFNTPLDKKEFTTCNCEDIFHREEVPLSLEEATFSDVLLKFKLTTGNVVWIKSNSNMFFVVSPIMMIKQIYAYFAKVKNLHQVSQLDSMSLYDQIFADDAGPTTSIDNLLYNTDISSILYAETIKVNEFTSFNDLVGEMRLKSKTSAIITKYDTILAGTITVDEMMRNLDKFYSYLQGDISAVTNYSPLSIHHDTLLFSALSEILQQNQKHCVIINRDNFPLGLLSSLEILRFLVLKLSI